METAVVVLFFEFLMIDTTKTSLCDDDGVLLVSHLRTTAPNFVLGVNRSTTRNSDTRKLVLSLSLSPASLERRANLTRSHEIIAMGTEVYSSSPYPSLDTPAALAAFFFAPARFLSFFSRNKCKENSYVSVTDSVTTSSRSSGKPVVPSPSTSNDEPTVLVPIDLVAVAVVVATTAVLVAVEGPSLVFVVVEDGNSYS